jgi:hypothetical protein
MWPTPAVATLRLGKPQSCADETVDSETTKEETMSKMGKRLIAAAKNARKIARGEADPATYRVHVAGTRPVDDHRQGARRRKASAGARLR